ncbi:MAG: DUF5655 domain-containing protein [Cytophaga sp.]|uniref:DUF5655 domain-containing protein n=1 Tax=Cytophaga sp. TaxID=29535 RepID=UPI003F81E0CA
MNDFLEGKTPQTKLLFDHFISQFEKVGKITVHPAKTMIGIDNGHKRIAWVTQFGRNFIHIVFPFKQSYSDNLCFQKIAPVPGDAKQFNHHFRMLHCEDINEEVLYFMKLAYLQEKVS